MKKWKIEYRDNYTPSPLSFWVHKQLDHDVWRSATQYDPPLPKAIPGKGYPIVIVIIQGSELLFSSAEEITHFLSVVSQKNMATSTQLSRKRDVKYGPNGHWLSRFPVKLKPWSKRKKIIPVIEEALEVFRAIYH